MKRVGNIYEKITSINAIKCAINFSSEGKTKRAEVREVLRDIDGYAHKIKAMLDNGEYKHSPYKVFQRFDDHAKKMRDIQKTSYYPDQIIHWLLINGLKETFMRGMYYYSCGSIEGRGIKHGVNAVKKWLHNDRKHTKYALKLDIKKFYESLPQDKLLECIGRKIKDEKVMQMLSAVIKSTPRGVPIGNYTSQWFANVYLEKLDHYIKETLGVKYYVRYIDDMVLFSQNKKELHKIRKKIFDFLRDELSLEVKNNWQLFLVESRYNSAKNYLIEQRNGNKMAYRSYCRYFTNLMSSLGMTHTIHETRHTFRTWLDAANANFACANRIMGHKCPDVGREVYTHKTIEELRVTIELIKVYKV